MATRESRASDSSRTQQWPRATSVALSRWTITGSRHRSELRTASRGCSGAAVRDVALEMHVKYLHIRPFVAFNQHIQLTAAGEVILRASRHQPQSPDRQDLQFRTDIGRRPCTLDGCRHTSTTEGREPNAQVAQGEAVQVPGAATRDLLGLGSEKPGELPLEAQPRVLPDDAVAHCIRYLLAA